MSVTFTFATYIESEVHGTILVMGSDHDHRAPETCCEDAAIYFGMCDHADEAELACGCRDHDVNLSNPNAISVLRRLNFDANFEDGIGGNATPDDFLGRVMVANVGLDDSGVAPVTDKAPGQACWIDCGIRLGYYDDVASRLADLATEAKARGCMIAWG